MQKTPGMSRSSCRGRTRGTVKVDLEIGTLIQSLTKDDDHAEQCGFAEQA